jgi:hypothetical protein
MTDLIDRGIDQIFTIDIGHNADAERIELFLQLCDAGVHGLDDLRRVLALQHLNVALNRRRVVVLAENTFRLLMAVFEPAEITDKNRHAIVLRHDNIAEIVEGADQSGRPDDIGLLTAPGAAAAAIGIIVVDRRDDI